jgi:type IV pilus assembly protein PilV
MTMRNNIIQHHSSQKGFTLLEAMIALVIFSISLIGIAGLQSQSLSFSQSAYLRSQATYLVYDMLDRMRANREAAESGNYDVSLGTTAPTATCMGTGSSCSQANIASADIYEWLQNVKTTMPGGDASVTRTTSGGAQIISISVYWDDKAEADGTNDITVTAEL